MLIFRRCGIIFTVNRVRVKAYAKINLTLDVLGRTGGYHDIESLAATVDLFDAVSVAGRRDGRVNITMRGMNSESIAPEDNNAFRAASAFVSRFGCNGADITVDKNIPVGAGLGGSSADAAAVINAMAKLYGITDCAALKEIADGTGSDTGYMLAGGYAVIRGRGCDVTPVYSPLKLDILLCLPRGGVSTPQCYARYDELGVRTAATTSAAVNALIAGDKISLGASLGNALFPAARTLYDGVASAFGKLAEFAPPGVNMTGSGSCVYALCESAEFCRYVASRISGAGRLIQVRTLVPKNYITEVSDG